MYRTSASWQQQLTEAITSPSELAALSGIDPALLHFSSEIDFPLRVPRHYASRIRPGNPQDPLLLQVLLHPAERPSSPDYTPAGYTQDPLNEQHANKIPGLLHKYFGRVLLIPTQACAVHCRYCFRRHFAYEANRVSTVEMQAITDYIQERPEIYEVILSGGDPFVLKDQTLASWIARLSELPQLRYLRIHSRLPIVIPARVTDTLVQLLKACRLKTTIVLHCNHPQEIESDVTEAIQKMRQHSLTVLNQSVLLRGINDQADTLIQLSHALYTAGALPYYLHLLDPIQGTAHFAVSEEQALALMTRLRAELPGFLVPRLVKEIAHAPSKVPLL